MGGTLGGLLVPLIAVHMFVFYFGLMADITPPMGLASFAAAAIARSDPIKTGITAFNYSMRTAILPFLFIFNTQLLLIGIENWAHLLLTITISITAVSYTHLDVYKRQDRVGEGPRGRRGSLVPGP